MDSTKAILVALVIALGVGACGGGDPVDPCETLSQDVTDLRVAQDVYTSQYKAYWPNVDAEPVHAARADVERAKAKVAACDPSAI